MKEASKEFKVRAKGILEGYIMGIITGLMIYYLLI